MMRILAISGSIRSKSTNRSLLLAAKSLAPAGIEIHLFEGTSKLPYFNPDLDHDSPPSEVLLFRKEIGDAKALIISTPEYAHGIPGVLKNALDWLVSSEAIIAKPIGLICGSASEGNHAQSSLLEILKTMSTHVDPSAIVNVPAVRTKFDETGKLTDPEVSLKIISAIEALVRSA